MTTEKKMYEGPMEVFNTIMCDMIDEVERFCDETQSERVLEILTGLKMAHVALNVFKDYPDISGSEILNDVLCFWLLKFEVAMEAAMEDEEDNDE